MSLPTMPTAPILHPEAAVQVAEYLRELEAFFRVHADMSNADGRTAAFNQELGMARGCAMAADKFARRTE